MPVTLPASALLRAELAPLPRTLVDIFLDTVADAPEQPAIDNGSIVLTYAELEQAATEVVESLRELGIGRGARVGVRVTSGTADLYVAILGVLLAGCAYVPVDVDDPNERARTVFDEAEVAAVIGDGLAISVRRPQTDPDLSAQAPEIADDAWIIFTSGSTGKPKGVAVSHRSAAAFVDAEAAMFLQDAPLGPKDRVMAGLSVAFDASCEEMWLAWRYGACLVPAPRSLVRSGTDLGPWLVANKVTVVSTVPTLVSLWPTEALAAVRLLILGGEACPPEIGARLANSGREVWNTYGPTEATVVSCGAQLGPDGPVRIGLPLDGWDLAVIDGSGNPVPAGQTGELLIGGVGLARYLDPEKDAEKYAAAPALGWDRAYRSGDLVRFDGEGLVFAGRADDQIKIGGRRIELGEIDSALLELPGVAGGAAAVRRTGAGNAVLVGYVSVDADFDAGVAEAALRERLPASNVPRIAIVDTLPMRTSGKIDRDALPWPVASAAAATDLLPGTSGWLQELWQDILGAQAGAAADFFALGGGSLLAAQLVARLREQFPEVTVAEVYEHPVLGDLATHLDSMESPAAVVDRKVRPVRIRAGVFQVIMAALLRCVGAFRWVVWLGVALALCGWLWRWDFLPQFPTAVLLLGLVVFVSPVGRVLLAAASARVLLRNVKPGIYGRGSKIHLRLWAAERFAEEVGADSLASAGLLKFYARLLGTSVGRGVDLHALPPITGFLTLGDNCSVELEVDLKGWWIDGDELHLGAIAIGPNARIGVRSTLGPGAKVGHGAEVGAGSTLLGEVPNEMFAMGSPAQVAGSARGPLISKQAPRIAGWSLVYAVTGMTISALPVLVVALGLAALTPLARGTENAGAVWLLSWSPAVAVFAFLVLALVILVGVRLLSIRIDSGIHPVHSRPAWQVWTILRLLDEARTWLFPIYSSLLTPTWLRALGADIGRDVEASTVLLLPSMTTVREGAFLADDTMLGMYELGGGWLRVEPVLIGKHAFVGNSGMAAPGRKVPKRGLVAVLSAAPRRAEAKKGTSWLGSPPTHLRRTVQDIDQERTYAPPFRLRLARAGFELARVLPVATQGVLAAAWAVAVTFVAHEYGWIWAILGAGPALVVAGIVAALIATAAKWLIVGRLSAGSRPLWHSMVWRGELADSFVEVLAASWFCSWASGTPALNWWLRSLGATVGRGVWTESYWLPEPDLITIGDGATVNRGCVVQTHLFHDRILGMDVVELKTGATLGPHSVVLPAAVIGRHATVGPGSLVMRGEAVPARTVWVGNPIGPWATKPQR